MKNDKNYDGLNNAHEQKIFEQELRKDIVLWEKSGMSKSKLMKLSNLKNKYLNPEEDIIHIIIFCLD